jgi:hypothetical protein
MRKLDEIGIPTSCLNKAKDRELLFVLIGRDAAAPHTIREWALERIRRGLNKRTDQQIKEALAIADQMQHEQFQQKIDDFTRGQE